MIKQISLNGEWSFREVGTETWRLGTVPGCVQLDLIHLGDMPDPFYRMNEIYMHRIEEKEWLYRKSFVLDPGDLECDQIDLVFEGLDTYAEVYLNGYFLDRTENMFIPHRFDVTDFVDEGENLLEIKFLSPLTTIRNLESKSPVILQSSCERARPYVRKAQYAYGWDWGPRIAQVGIWRPVYLELIEAARIIDPSCYTLNIAGDTAQLHVQATIESYVEDDLEAEVIISREGQVAARTQVPVEEARDGLQVNATIDIEHPALWWPNGLGEQPLYDITIRVQVESESGRNGSSHEDVIAETTFRTGIRTVRLVQEADVEGRSFIFEINGVRVFAKGANWIPADNLLPRLTPQDYDQYIALARDAHMNMLRIWGGGIYEDPAFYQACDRYGIMVWQDFMYACAQYPDEFDWFQELAEEEAVAVVTALRNHPSIVLWCGNNENNWVFDEWWHNGQPKYLGNYIYREILPRVCSEYDPSRPYWVSSPYGGDKPNSMAEGDRHAWLVWSNWQDYDHYRQDTGRFISEFGFQAMPDWRTVLAYTAPEDRTILSPVMRSHQKMTEGMERLVRFLVGRVGFPKDLKSFVYLTQFNQAEAIKTGVEHWRLRKFMTSGTLYWQFNDCWPVASWSCLDYYKRKKGLFYASKRFYAPVLPIPRLENGELAIYGVNDLPDELEAQLRISAYRLSGDKLYEAILPITLLANETVKLKKLGLNELGIGYTPRILPVDGPSTTYPQELNGDLLDTVLFVELQAGELMAKNVLTFGRFRDLSLNPTAINVAVEGQTINLISTVPAFGVFVETEREVDLSDNCLTLEPGVPYRIACSAAPGHVQVYSLVDLVAVL